MRRRNIGIGPGDILKYGILVGGLVWGAGKLSKFLGKEPAPTPGGDKVPDQTTIQLTHTDYEGYVLPGATLHVTWTLNHLGPSGQFIAGIQIRPITLFGISLGGGSGVLQTMQQGFSVSDDALYKTYQITGVFDLIPGIAHNAFDVRQYITDTGGNILSELWTYGALVIG